jgi:hypothetical protein
LVPITFPAEFPWKNLHKSDKEEKGSAKNYRQNDNRIAFSGNGLERFSRAQKLISFSLA